MKKNIFLIFCITFLIFSCSPVTIEEDEDSPGERRGNNSPDENASEEIEIGEQVKNICKGDGYIVYSYGECPEGTGIGTYDEDGRAEEDNLTPPQPVDIFFVLNANSSMYYYLTYLTSMKNNTRFQKRFQSFIPTLIKNNMDWRMFFTNSDYSDGIFAKGGSGGYFKGRNGKAMNLEGRYGILREQILDPTVSDLFNTFMYTITRGPDRTGDQRGGTNVCDYPPYCSNVRPLKALKSSFSKNKNLTRKEAHFIAIIVSNRDEEDKKVTAEEIINEFRSVYGSDKRLSVLSVIIEPDDTKCFQKNEDRTFFVYHHWQKGSYGVQISKLAKKTGGGNFSICLEDYSILAKTIVHLSSQ
ncbi:MAG: hypothetical protein OXM55_07690 [Bdellovibrionales bacterium]|nr:hypothetical protein [Bdellovibrionales bacterium]